MACCPHPSASLEQDALDELRKNRSNLDLHVPLLSEFTRVHWHVLYSERKLDGQTAKLHHLAHAEPDGNRPDIPRRRGEVGQDITRVEDVPALAEEDRRDGLQIHLVRIGPAVLAADGPPLLREHTDEVLFGEVAYDHAGSELPLA